MWTAALNIQYGTSIIRPIDSKGRINRIPFEQYRLVLVQTSYSSKLFIVIYFIVIVICFHSFPPSKYLRSIQNWFSYCDHVNWAHIRIGSFVFNFCEHLEFIKMTNQANLIGIQAQCYNKSCWVGDVYTRQTERKKKKYYSNCHATLMP